MSLNVNRPPYTVTQLNASAKAILESSLGFVWLSGEISNLVMASSGHWYFSLKDERSQVRCAMFRGQNRQVAFKPDNGMQILARVSVTLYEPRGDFQLVVQSMQGSGEGALQQAFEALKMKLAAEGLFAQSGKKAIPAHPKAVGVISSATGAALHDILTVLKRRAPYLPVIIYPSQVQGDAAPGQLVNALHHANQRNEVDVLILGRGGGSKEDLWCFNDEGLARAIFNSQIPIISAVGHEIDISISDLVADLRAPTPSAAAELVATDQSFWLNQLKQLRIRLNLHVKQYTTQRSQQLSQLANKLSLQHPRHRLMKQSQQLDELTNRLTLTINRQLHRRQSQLEQRHVALLKATPSKELNRISQQLQHKEQALYNAIKEQLTKNRERWLSASTLLEAVSPLATLQRGYSITSCNNRVIRHHDQVAPGDEIATQLADGKVISKVIRCN